MSPRRSPPRVRQADRSKAAAGGQVREARGNGETILLVEDERPLLALGQTALERLGYVVLAAPSPADALRLAGSHPGPIHLLVTDVVMPGMNGGDLAARVRALRPGAPCLFVSGYPADVITDRGVLNDGVHFLQKPYTLDELARSVGEAIARAGAP